MPQTAEKISASGACGAGGFSLSLRPRICSKTVISKVKHVTGTMHKLEQFYSSVALVLALSSHVAPHFLEPIWAEPFSAYNYQMIQIL